MTDQDQGHSFLLRDGTRYEVPADFVGLLEATYPRIDPNIQFPRIALWCEENPRKRKTRRGARRFVLSWWSRLYRDKQYDRESPFISSWITEEEADQQDLF